MDDYMYHDYDSDREQPKSRSKRLRSVIGTVLALCWFAAIAVWIISRDTENIRTDFSETAFETHRFSDNIVQNGDNQFMALKEQVESGKRLLVDKDFRKKYPDIYRLLTSDVPNSAETKVYSFDSNGYMTVVEPYISSRSADSEDSQSSDFTGTLGADILMLPYAVSGGELKIGGMIRYSITCDMTDSIGVASVTQKEFRSDGFRLNFYDISVKITGAASAEYTLSLSEYPTKSECDNMELFDNITLSAKPGILTGGNDPTLKFISGRGDIPDDRMLTLEFDKLMYRKYGGFSVKTDNSNAEFSVILNKGK